MIVPSSAAAQVPVSTCQHNINRHTYTKPGKGGGGSGRQTETQGEPKVTARASQPLPQRVVCRPQARVIYQRPGSLRVRRSIVAFPRTATSDVVPGICRSFSPSLWFTAPSAPITTGTTSFLGPLSALSIFFVYEYLLVFLLPDVAFAQDCHIYYHPLLLLFVNQQESSPFSQSGSGSPTGSLLGHFQPP